MLCLISFSSQLGANPSFLNGEKLGQGNCGSLTHGGVLYLINQDHPLKLHYSLVDESFSDAKQSSAKTQGESSRKEKQAQSHATYSQGIEKFFSKRVSRLLPFVCLLTECLLFQIYILRRTSNIVDSI